MRGYLRDDLVIVTMASLLAAAVALLELPTWIRFPIGLLPVFWLPGYAISVALFPGREIDVVERLVLSVTLSIALVIVLAPVLDLTWGLGPRPLVIGLTLATVGSCAIAWLRRPGGGAGRTICLQGKANRSLGWPMPRVVWLTVAMVGAAVVLTFAAPPARYTEFYATGAAGYADTYPRGVQAGAETAITVGIVNREGERTSYNIVAASGSSVVGTLDSIVVDPGQTWIGDLSFVIAGPGSDRALDIDLFRDGDTSPYRSLRLWLEVAPAG
jgi:uncharacterized membrane protein